MILVKKIILKFTWFISLFTSASIAIFSELQCRFSAELPSLFIPPLIYSYVTETATPPFFQLKSTTSTWALEPFLLLIFCTLLICSFT